MQDGSAVLITSVGGVELDVSLTHVESVSAEARADQNDFSGGQVVTHGSEEVGSRQIDVPGRSAVSDRSGKVLGIRTSLVVVRREEPFDAGSGGVFSTRIR